MEQKIILLSGEIVDLKYFQAHYGINPQMIGRFFNLSELSVEEFVFAEPLIRLIDVARVLYNKPLKINSDFRSTDRQKELKKKGYRVATNSPHVVGMAWDLDTTSKAETYELVKALKYAAQLLGYDIRLGYKKYLDDGNTFVHVDVCPMFFGKDAAFYEMEHPYQWEYVTEW